MQQSYVKSAYSVCPFSTEKTAILMIDTECCVLLPIYATNCVNCSGGNIFSEVLSGVHEWLNGLNVAQTQMQWHFA